MSDFFGFTERYLTTDGKEYIDAACVREALGIGEDYNADILGEIKKLKEERERYKSNCDYFAGIAQDRLRDRNKLELGLREALGTVDEYADIIGLVRKLREERDQLKDRVRRLRIQANSIYGASCGYSSGDTPVFKTASFVNCTFSYTGGENTEIEATFRLYPNANYKGEFDTQNFADYITHYDGRKKLGIVEAADYQNAKAARAELSYLYRTVLGKERLDRDLSPHEVMKAILDAVKQLRDAQFASDQCLRSVYMHVHEGTECKTSDIYAAPDKLAEGIITRYNAARMLSRLETLREIDDHIDKICDEYHVVKPDHKSTTKERLDYIFAVLDDHRKMHGAEWKRVEELEKEKQSVEDARCEFLRELSCSLGFGNPVVKPDSIDQKEKDILERVEKLKSGVWPCENTSTFAEFLRKEFPKFCKAYNVTPLVRPCSIHDWIHYIFEKLTDYRDLADGNYKNVEGLRKEKKEFLDSVCEVLNIAPCMTYQQILTEVKNIVDCNDELTDFRVGCLDALNIDNDELIGSPRQNDKYILEQVEKLKGSGCDAEKEFLDAVKKRIGVSADCSDHKYMLRCLDIKLDHSSLSAFTDSVYEELGLNRYGYTLTDAANELKMILRSNARSRSDVCIALGLGNETSDEDILKSVRKTKDCYDALCKDYTELRKAIWDAMGCKPETLPEETARLVGEVRMLQLKNASLKRLHVLQLKNASLKRLHDEVAKAIGMDYPVTSNDIINRVKFLYDANGSNLDVISDLKKQVVELARDKKLLVEFRDDVAKAIGIEYPAANNVILNNVKYLHKDREDAYGMVAKLNDQVTALEKAKEELQQKFQFQFDLRQQWHARYDSEHERANGEHKRVEKLRDDVTALKKKVDFLEESSNTQWNEVVALQSFKNECRKLKEEKTKVISALGQDIWDDCLK